MNTRPRSNIDTRPHSNRNSSRRTAPASDATARGNYVFRSARELYEWKFLVADVKRSLIGADFLTHSSLLVDLRNNRLVHPEELNSTPLQRTRHRSRITGLAFAATANPSPLSKLFAEFPVVTVPNFNIARPKHAVQHTIETKGQPLRSKARPLPPQKLAAAKAKFAEMASSGIVRRSNGPWSSPLHVVSKQDGSFRMCGDYRRLNTVTTPDRYSIPLIADLTTQLHGKKYFGKVDLIRGYHQIPVARRRRPKDGHHDAFRNLWVPSNAVRP